MRLLKIGEQGGLSLTKDLHDDIPPYAILSHTWGANDDEIEYDEFVHGPNQSKKGYDKIQFCKEQALKDQLRHFWIDTCCINKANHTELSTAISSMFRWYRDAEKCYVYLSDVDANIYDGDGTSTAWEGMFRASRWFKRGWTLQELLAPSIVEFYSRQGQLLGSKKSLERIVHEITTIPVRALRDGKLSDFPDDERMRWTEGRATKLPQDKVYCLLGIFGISIAFNYGEEEDLVWRRFREEIAKRTGLSPWTIHTHWLVKRPLNPLFVGREDILQELQATVRDAVFDRAPRDDCRIVITGMGGQGKSELCLQLAQSLRQIFWGVFWIDVGTTSLAEKSFLDIAQNLGIPASSWEDACLRISNLKDPWLLVLDNADNPEVDYQHYFPSGALGVTILTSRVPECRAYATTRHIALEELPEAQAQELVLKAAGLPVGKHELHKTEAAAIVELLGFHTLALIQAGAYVARGHCGLAQYPAIYHQRRQRLLQFHPKQGRSRYGHVYATFEASADILEQTHSEEAKDALQLLPLLAVCGPNRVPLRVFESCWKRVRTVYQYRQNEGEEEEEDVLFARMKPWHVAHLPPFIEIDERETWDAFRLMEAVQQLESLALISVDRAHDDAWLSMHPLIHAWARDRQDRIQQHSNWLQMSCVVAFSLTENEGDDEDVWDLHRRQLPPHIEALTSWEGDVMYGQSPPVHVTSILVICGWNMCHRRADSALFTLIRKIFAFRKLDLKIVEGGMLGLYDLAALNLSDRGREKEAIDILEQVVRISEERLAEDDRNRLSFELRLANAYRGNGQVKESLELFQHIVKLEKQTLAEDDPSLLASQQGLALAYRENGQVKESLEILEHIVRIGRRTMPEDLPDLLASQHSLALAYRANGRLRESMELFRHVLKSGEHALPEGHPDRLGSQHCLALLYNDTGQLDESLKLFQHVVRIGERTLTEDHPTLLAAQHGLASTYKAKGYLNEALEAYRKVVRMSERILAENDRRRLYAEANVAGLLWRLGDRESAIDILARIAPKSKQVFEDDNSDREDWEERLRCWRDEMNGSTHTGMELPATDSSSAEESIRNEAGPMSKKRKLDDSIEADRQ